MVIPYAARKKLDLHEGIFKIIDVSKAGLGRIKLANDDKHDIPDKHFGFDGVKLRTSGVDFSDDEMSDLEYLADNKFLKF